MDSHVILIGIEGGGVDLQCSPVVVLVVAHPCPHSECLTFMCGTVMKVLQTKTSKQVESRLTLETQGCAKV